MKNDIDSYEDLTEGEMNSLLLEFQTTSFYRAVMKYLIARSGVVNDGLRSLDPFRQPTELARNQGIGMGLLDLSDYIKLLREKSVEAEKPTKK